MTSRWRTLPDYNRGLWLPVRWASRALLVVSWILEPVTTWMNDERRRDWARPLVLGLIATLLVLRLDALLAPGAPWAGLGGDIRREWDAWQQYGALTSVIVVALLVFLLDRGRVRRLADLAIAWLLVGGATNLIKPLIGRARPKYHDVEAFVGPFGAYPVTRHGEPSVLTPWQAGYELASMPSSHTAAAVALSVFLAVTYPRIRPLAIGLAVLVGLGRVWSGAHWPSDVVLGATVGLAIALPVVRRGLGRRVLRLGDSSIATPSLARGAPSPQGVPANGVHHGVTVRHDGAAPTRVH